MNELGNIIIATLAISIIALIGIFTLAIHDKTTQKILFWLIGLSSGALMGGAFLHLMPEANEMAEETNVNIFLWVLIAFILFFIVEKILHWRHCHKEKCEVHTFGTMNLIGDAIHNFIDGLIIAAAFTADTSLGIATTFAVALHEIPQEIGDFGVLLYAGYSKKKAILFNFLTALFAVLGGIIGYYITSYSNTAELYLLPIAAGGFIYIAASDLLPEIRKEKSLIKSLTSFGFFIVGILLMYFIK
jgi:zinc and cadmium transporter